MSANIASYDIVLQLREELDLNGIEWIEVRGYPQATYLDTLHYTIWWHEPPGIFKWGHNFEHEVSTVEAVIAWLLDAPPRCDHCHQTVRADMNSYWVGDDNTSDCNVNPGGHTVNGAIR